MGPHGEAVVVETIASDEPVDDLASALDLLMYVLATGRERTAGHYRELFEQADLHIERQQLLATGATAFTLTSRS